MSKGSPRIVIRVPRQLLDVMTAQIRQRNAHTRRPPWNQSSFIIDAIEEKLHKMARGRGKKRAELPARYERDNHTFG